MARLRVFRQRKSIMITRRFLYVDDDPAIRLLVKRFFEIKFPTHEVIVVASAEEAMQELRRRRDGAEFPNALVSDFQLGSSGNGARLVEMVRVEFPNLRTVVVSGASLRTQMQASARAGASAFLEKGMMQPFVDRLFDLLQCPTAHLPPVTTAH